REHRVPWPAVGRVPRYYDFRVVAALEGDLRYVQVPVRGAAGVVDGDPLFVGDAGVPRTAEFVARSIVAGEHDGCEVVRGPEVRVPGEDDPTRELRRTRPEREPRQVDAALAVRGDHGVAPDFPSRIVHGRLEPLGGGFPRDP